MTFLVNIIVSLQSSTDISRIFRTIPEVTCLIGWGTWLRSQLRGINVGVRCQSMFTVASATFKSTHLEKFMFGTQVHLNRSSSHIKVIRSGSRSQEQKCICLVWALTFECLDLESSLSAHTHMFRISTSNSYNMVIGLLSRKKACLWMLFVAGLPLN